MASALAQMKAIALKLERQYPDSNRGQGASVMQLSEAIVGDIRPILLVLLGGAGLLLVYCVRECIKSAAGARGEPEAGDCCARSTGRVAAAAGDAQFVTEATALVAVGAALGLLLADGGMKVLQGLISKDMMIGMPYLRGLGLNAHVLVFAALPVDVGSGAVFDHPILHFRFSKMRDGLT